MSAQAARVGQRRSRTSVSCLQFLESTALAAFITNDQGRIVTWNRAAEELLGLPAGRVLGKRCFETVGGLDLFGNVFCTRLCAARQMASHQEPIHGFDLILNHAAGETRRARCVIILIPGPDRSKRLLLHLLEPEVLPEASWGDSQHKGPGPAGGATSVGDRQEGEGQGGSGGLGCLTPRERGVLRLLAAGGDTAEISRTLGISRCTVRNHVQHLLEKLHVHNRLQAIVIAHRDNLI